MVKVPLQYVESVLETSGDDFESTDDLYEAIGEVGFSKSGREVDKVELLWNEVDCLEIIAIKVLHEMEEEKSEKDIRYILHMCNTLMMYEEQSQTFPPTGMCVNRF